MKRGPKLVDGLTPAQAVAIGCDSCGWNGVDDDPSDGSISSGVCSCSVCAHGRLFYRYDDGTPCGGCGKLDYEQPVKDDHGGYCSRKCLLQAEYARSIAGAA